MAKIKLGARPKSFEATVSFPMLDGSTGTIKVTYKYRTKTEFAQFIDKTVADAGVEVEDAPEKFSMSGFVGKTLAANVDYILDVVDGWSLDEDLTPLNVRQLADEIPAAAVAIMETYRTAINEGRLGN